jgi:hypothetical protein
LLALKWLVLILVRLSKLEDKLFSQEGEDDQNGPSPNSPDDSNAKEVILSKSVLSKAYSDSLEFGVRGPFPSPNGCTLLSVVIFFN